MIAIYIPTLRRPHVLRKLVANIHSATVVPHKIYFIAEGDDLETIAMCDELNEDVLIHEGEPRYSTCINMAYRMTKEPYFLCANDDFFFHPMWDENAFHCFREGIHVVGVNDLGTGEGRTIFLVERSYIETQSGVIDQPNTVYHEYFHNYVDTEFVETAISRGVYIYCPESIVEHMHPGFGKAEWDDTYRKGLASYEIDTKDYFGRRHLWLEN